MIKRFRYTLLLLAVMAATSCNMYKEVEVVSVGEVELTEMGSESIFAEVPLKIHNPNGYKVKLVESDIDLTINGIRAGKVKLAEHMTIARKSTGDYVLKLRSDYDEMEPDFLSSMFLLLFTRKAQFHAEGYVKGKAFMVGKKVDVLVDEEVEW